jgi:hypothetical protein
MRKVTNDDISKYDGMIEMYMKDSVKKNWNESSLSKNYQDTPLGNSGWTMRDFRQYLRCEVVVALQKYDPEYRTKEGRSVKESTFVFRHLYNRIGQLLKKLTKRTSGYGVWMANIEETLWETDKSD